MDVGNRDEEVAQKDAQDIIEKAEAGDLSAFQDAVVAYEAKHGVHLADTKVGRGILYLSAAYATNAGHGEIVLHLCREWGVLTNAIPDDDECQVSAVTGRRTPLTAAIECGHEDLAMQLLAIPQPPGMEATKRLADGTSTILHLAAKWGALRVVEALVVEHGMDMNAKDDGGYTPLDLGAMQGGVAVARFLLQKQRESGGLEQAFKRDWPNKLGFHGPTLLFIAVTVKAMKPNPTDATLNSIEEGILSMTRLLVEEFGADATGGADGVSPGCLHAAATAGKLSVVRYFIENCGFPVDDLDENRKKSTPLHCACMFEEGVGTETRVLLVVEYLCGKGASLILKNSDGKDALELAKEKGNLRIYRYLLTQRFGRGNVGGGDSGGGGGEGKSSTESADRSGSSSSSSTSSMPDDDDENSVKLAIDSLRKVGREGNVSKMREEIDGVKHDFPVIWQCVGYEIVRKVAFAAAYSEQGAAVAKYLCSEYDLPAWKWESEEVLPEECTNGVPRMDWPLMGALNHNDEELALALLALPLPAGERLDLEYRLVSGRTLLHYAAQLEKPQLMRALLERGAEHGVVDLEKETPLDKAVRNGFVEVARLLLDRYKAKGEMKRTLLRPWASQNDGNLKPLLVLAIVPVSNEALGFREHVDVSEATRLSMVRMLVNEYEANPSVSEKIVGPDGKTNIILPLHSAAAAGFTSIVDFFVDECDISVETLSSPHKLTPLHTVCAMEKKSGKEEEMLRMVKHLVEAKGANVLAEARGGATPRWAAQASGYRRIAEYLEEKEKDAKEAAEAAAEAARAALLEELETEEEKGKEGKKKGTAGGGGGGSGGGGGGSARSGGGSGSSSKKKKKRNTNNNNSKNKGTTAAAGGGGGNAGGAAAAGGGAGSAQAATITAPAAVPAVAMAAVEESMEGLDLGDDEGKEQDRVVAKAEEAEEEDGPGHVVDIQDEETFILEGAPKEFFCPITTELMVNPVLASDGYMYEEHAIKEWIETCKRKGQEITSPMGCKMEAFTMQNKTHKTLILDWIQRKKEEWKIICAEREAMKKKKK